MAGRPKGDGAATHKRIVETAAQLFREKGYDGVGLQEIVEIGQVPKGSLYFHFPDGKEQIAKEAMTEAAMQYYELIFKEALVKRNQGLGVKEMLQAAFDALRNQLLAHDFKMGCPIAALAQTHASPGIRELAARLYQGWETEIVSLLGLPKEKYTLATAVLATVEGSLLLARTYRSLEPLDQAERLLIIALSSEGPS